MKLGVIILVIFGLVAAGSAAVLVTTMQLKPSNKTKTVQQIEVAVLKKDLPAMVAVTVDDFTKQTVPKNALPKGNVSAPTQVIGRILAVPAVKGQILTEECFITQGSGAQLAAALPAGMRAFTVVLSSRGIPDRLLLYPGCSVDVLYTARLSSQDSRGQAMSATILRGIQVLAVEGNSVVKNPQAEEGSKPASARNSGSPQVTLLVDPKQAEALQLAMENGSISLTVRNPLDKNMGQMDATILNQDQLTLFGSAMTLKELSAEQQKQRLDRMAELLAALTDPNRNTTAKVATATDANAPAKEQAVASVNPEQKSPKVELPPQEANTQPAKNPHWGVIVISGKETKTKDFLLTPNEDSEEK
jgi:Flp pilus assembly protein CpaB